MDQLQRKHKTPATIHELLVHERKKSDLTGPGLSTVYEYLAGNSYKRDAEETRGRESLFGRKELHVYDNARKRLQKESAASDHPWVVTWGDIATAGQRELRKLKLLLRGEKGLAAETLRKRMRESLGVGKRPAPKHAVRTKDEEGRRYRQAGRWKKYTNIFWLRSTYIDNKRFVMARTPAQRKRMRQARVRYHLRKAAERSQREYISPKQNHQLCGIPSVEISAAVACDRIIMWYVVPKKWCGEQAAVMYKELGKHLRRRWGSGLRGFRVVEDGDPKGYQSGKGHDAKASQKIQSWKLPPRSPEWMPLDYCLWEEIERRMFETVVKGTETKERWLLRLRKTALSLPRPLVKRTILQMKKRIAATYDSKGGHIKMA